MKHVPQDKYNVAWFTLAECISRGEKVRALGVYRLLSHSMDDSAFAKQLEADILLAFQDKEGAIAKYQEAAHLYQKNDKCLEAVAVYEHLRDLEPEKIEYIQMLVHLYSSLNMHAKIVHTIKLLCEVQLKHKDFKGAIISLEALDGLLNDPSQTAYEHEKMVFALLNSPDCNQDQVLKYIKSALEGFIFADDNRALQKFLAALQVIAPEYAEQAYASVQGSTK